MRYYTFDVLMRGKREKKHQITIVPIRTTSEIRAMGLAEKKHPTLVAVAAAVSKGLIAGIFRK